MRAIKIILYHLEMSINIDADNENIKTPVAVSSGTVEADQNSFATLLLPYIPFRFGFQEKKAKLKAMN